MRYILVQQRESWHVCKKQTGSTPVYTIMASTKSETHARDILAALIYRDEPTS